MRRCGFAVLYNGEPARDIPTAVGRLRPDLLVLELALAGARGLGIVPAVLDAAPGCRVVLVSTFDKLRAPALEAGAYDLVGRDDFRDLEQCLRRLQAEAGRHCGPGSGEAEGTAAAMPPSEDGPVDLRQSSSLL
jgi:hypothetical protein